MSAPPSRATSDATSENSGASWVQPTVSGAPAAAALRNFSSSARQSWCAVVISLPRQPRRTARRAVYAGMAALADALAVYAPPEKPIAFDWPDAVRVDGGLVGGGRLAWPAGAAEDDVPAWLVFGAMIRTVAMGEAEPGL